MSLTPVTPRELQEYLTPDGRNPFREWLRGLKDVRTRAIVRVRLNRVRLGNLGHCRALAEGVSELKIDHGPGFRIYFGEDGDTLVILLCGGDKGSQRADIHKAKAYWRDYRRVGHAEANPEV